MSKSFGILKKNKKKNQKCKKLLKHVKKYQKVLKKSFNSQKKIQQQKMPDLLFAFYLLTFIRTK